MAMQRCKQFSWDLLAACFMKGSTIKKKATVQGLYGKSGLVLVEGFILKILKMLQISLSTGDQ